MAPFGQFQKARFAYFLVQVGIQSKAFDWGRKRGVKAHSNVLTGNNLANAILDKCAKISQNSPKIRNCFLNLT